VIFTPLHGVGAISAIPLMEKFDIQYNVVECQNDLDPKFSSVKSPNPEDKDALQLAIDEAKHRGCDIVLATDADGDRVAIVAKNKVGEFEYFSGNIAWSLLAEYRLSKWKEQGFLDISNGNNIAIVKTFVTTPLLDKIAQNFGIKCVNTLTGFKWIGEKMASYERKMLAKVEDKFGGMVLNYDATSAIKRRELLMKYSTFFAFGCEESYGCLSSDIVRDKDANSGVLMLCELAAYARQRGMTLCELRDEIFKKYGYFGESILNIYYDGAEGIEKIANILLSYRESKPEFMGGARVTKFTDFMKEELFDTDGKKIPKQNFFFVELENGCQFAVRASGTEPKIKFYIFCECKTSGDLNLDKQHIEALLSEMKMFLELDADVRSKFRA
jgi:phosphoglucomutase